MAGTNTGRALACLLLIPALLAGCGTTGGRAVVPPRPLAEDLPVLQVTSSDARRTVPAAATNPTDSIDLRQAVALTLLHSPELAAHAWETRAAEARLVQAGHIPNPVLNAIAEDIGSRSGSTTDQQSIQPQTTIQLNQLVEMGGKRTGRLNVAARARDLAAWDYETARIDALTAVTRDFVDVLAAQEMLALAVETTRLVEEVRQSVATRVVAGVVSPIEETRANVSLAATRVESTRAARQLEAARARLAANWGAVTPSYAGVRGDLNQVADIPPFAALVGALAANPDLARWSVEIAHREAALSLERARRIPDLTLTGGVRWFTALDRNAYVIGGSFPVPLFDRNRGGIDEARSQVGRAYEEQRAAQSRVTSQLADAYRALSSAYDEVKALRETVRPGAQQTFELVSEGYRLGKFGYLDVLDAQRTLVAAGTQYLTAIAEYHKAVAEVERLVGARLGTIVNPQR
jgi:outer membrane protein, heavy metal efflux system